MCCVILCRNLYCVGVKLCRCIELLPVKPSWLGELTTTPLVITSGKLLQKIRRYENVLNAKEQNWKKKKLNEHGLSKALPSNVHMLHFIAVIWIFVPYSATIEMKLLMSLLADKFSCKLVRLSLQMPRDKRLSHQSFSPGRTGGNAVSIVKVLKSTLSTALRAIFQPEMHHIAWFCVYNVKIFRDGVKTPDPRRNVSGAQIPISAWLASVPIVPVLRSYHWTELYWQRKVDETVLLHCLEWISLDTYRPCDYI